MTTTRDYYERYWAAPDAAPPAADPTTPRRKSLLARALSDTPKGATVLDLGCGSGLFSEYLAGLGFDVIGSDLSERAVQAAAVRVPGGRFIAGEPAGLAPEYAGRIDAVWCSEVIEHVFDVHAFLAATHALLKPGGLLVLTTPYHGLLKNIGIDLASYDRHYNPFGGHIRFFNRKNLGRCLRHCGFTPRRWSGYGRPWPLYKSFFVVAVRSHEVAPPPPADS